MRMQAVADASEARRRFEPFLRGELESWRGLPDVSIQTITEALGPPEGPESVTLGWFRAERFEYRVESATGGMAAYARDGRVVLVESLVAPDISASNRLGEPCAVKPQEIVVPDAYVHEYLYCDRGLVLSIAEPFASGSPSRILRCRGIAVMAEPSGFGPDLYRAFEDQVVW
jgi:hypothetical protein